MNTDINQRVANIVAAVLQLKSMIYPTFSLKISYLTLFAQSHTDYENLVRELTSQGNKSEANNGCKFDLSQPITVSGECINLIRIRKHDVHRPELGCADFSYLENDYSNLRNIAIERGLDIIIRKGYEMIELSTFDIPAYAYLVKETV